MYAIQHKETGLFLTGTDFSHVIGNGFKQFVFVSPLKVYEERSDAVKDFKRRKCGRAFKIVEVK